MNALNITREIYTALMDDKTKCGEFYSLTTDEERIKFTLRFLRDNNKLHPLQNVTYEGKSNSRSTYLKNKGNVIYKLPFGMKDSLNTIIDIYTTSVAYALPGSRELSLAYANRSAVLFTAKLYDDCLQDIERALKLDYPEKLKAKLFARKARCLKILYSSALEGSRHWLKKMDLNDPGRKSVEMILEDPKQLDIYFEKPRKLLDDKRNFPEIPNDNPEIPGASSAIALKYSHKFGRHIVATRDIEPGEVLLVEQSYASVVEMNQHYNHCENCLKQTWSAIPCDYCVEVIYCSETCRQAAWNDHHDVECQVLGPLIALGISNVGLLALRLAVRAVKETGSLQALKNELTEPRTFVLPSPQNKECLGDLKSQGFTGNVFNGKKYAGVYTLARNTEKRSVTDLFTSSVSSTLVLYMLATKSTMFGEKLDGDLGALVKKKWVTFIGGLLLRHHQIVTVNFQGILGVNEETLIPWRATAIMPFNNLFNHSCRPMIGKSSFGRSIAVFASHFIKKDEQIFDCYDGFNYILTSKTKRQERLKQKYHFVCECIACREDWPIIADLPSLQGQTWSKQSANELNFLLMALNKIHELQRAGNIENTPEMSKQLTKIIKFFDKHVHQPAREVAQVDIMLISTYSMLGNRWQLLV